MVICKSCKEKMNKLDYVIEGNAVREVYECSNCELWCTGIVKKDTLVNTEWHKQE